MITSLKEEFESRVTNLEREQVRQQTALEGLQDLSTILHLEHEVNVTSGLLTVEIEEAISVPEPKMLMPIESVTQASFAVCLMFNQQAPSEWSEETCGWRIANHGMHFTDYEQASRCAEKLRVRFPDYPIEVREVTT
ncbi:MAG: hypothetical protein PHP00_15340 [Thiotrichaceae bacterium]|nr:hypothetical protein [Thiotrichaceae bacterium]